MQVCKFCISCITHSRQDMQEVKRMQNINASIEFSLQIRFFHQKFPFQEPQHSFTERKTIDASIIKLRRSPQWKRSATEEEASLIAAQKQCYGNAEEQIPRSFLFLTCGSHSATHSSEQALHSLEARKRLFYAASGAVNGDEVRQRAQRALVAPRRRR
jgi:hypothetical protein